uniref:Ras and Rab interactor 2a n=1 Tax=Cyprinodon variegatus TaxID=28743 RepID=A0A3Q2DZA2_CYPVA
MKHYPERGDTMTSPPCEQQKRGSFFQLIDSIAWEIGTLKQEMRRKSEPAEGLETDPHVRLSEEVGRLFLQASPCPAMGGGPPKARDSGYDSLHRGLSFLDRLTHTHSVWLQLGLSHRDAAGILQDRAAGSFLVRRSSRLQRKVVSVRMDRDSTEPIKDFPIRENQYNRVLEKALIKCVLKPLKPTLSAALKDFQVSSGSWQELKDNLSLAKARRPQEMGVTDALPPDPVAVEKIRQKFQVMCKLYSPEKKVCTLLRVCKLIYTIMEDNSGRLYGADDFLPMLTYVLAQCDMPELDNEILYMMELLDPLLLHGEGGYYLTSAYGAMSLIKNLQEDQAARVLSSETRDTLHQWHRRRTTQRSAPSIDDFQNYLRVALHESGSGCTAKTLQVRPYATVEELCQLCAVKFKVSDPENYGLFLQTEGSSQQLAADTHPQKIKAELHSCPQPVPFHFVYRRLATSSSPSAGLSSAAPDPRAHPNQQNTGAPAAASAP